MKKTNISQHSSHPMVVSGSVVVQWVSQQQEMHSVYEEIRLFREQHGITLNADKFILATPETTFCGYRLSKDGIPADPEKVPYTCQPHGSSWIYGLCGLGYALLQDHSGGRLILVQYGSRFLTNTETRYATIELELQAVVWAMSKCKSYLIGLQHFSLVIDHRPLVPILNHYSLDAIENLRLQWLKMKISPYIFTSTWRTGKTLWIPDALSRSPVDRPTSDDEAICNETCISVSGVTLCAVKTIAVPCVNEQEDLHLEDLRKAASEDTTYRELLHHVRSGFPNDRYDLQNSLRPYWKIRDDLYCDGNLVLYGARMVIPTALRRRILTRLHDSHCGFEATKRRAISFSVDRFLFCSWKFFLVYIDHFSNWPVVIQRGTDTTARTTIRFFRHLFRDLGVPERVCTDGRPQFTS
ncbi:uncharacterized protein LOC122260291 [Penaeus japonicus]|uniref:uncharacterized protein LOC122260291 n=1 Tax=Penaeus japonicus TaxID=27405 RepID=UPI001C714774|nr:uncharacterized protein LOC122260291 [Penaeus japonicus]